MTSAGKRTRPLSSASWRATRSPSNRPRPVRPTSQLPSPAWSLAHLMASLAILWATPGSAHELRPAYLRIDEAQPGRYEVLWKRPERGGRGLALSVTWPEGCRDAVLALLEMVAGAAIERRLIDCGAAGLVGQGRGVWDVGEILFQPICGRGHAGASFRGRRPRISASRARTGSCPPWGTRWMWPTPPGPTRSAIPI
jgi:hypothetical protein